MSTLYLPLIGGTLTGNVTIEKSSTGDCMYWTQVTDTGFTPKIGFGTGASKNRGLYDTTKGWFAYIDTNDNVYFKGRADIATNADYTTYLGTSTDKYSKSDLDTLFAKYDENYNWFADVVLNDETDGYINKWHEIVGFLDSVAEETDILDEFVTRKTEQEIIGIKTFTEQTTFNELVYHNADTYTNNIIP